MRLRDHPFKIFYSAADDRLHEFYIPALLTSTQYDRSAGFFSSSALAIAAAQQERARQLVERLANLPESPGSGQVIPDLSVEISFL